MYASRNGVAWALSAGVLRRHEIGRGSTRHSVCTRVIFWSMGSKTKEGCEFSENLRASQSQRDRMQAEKWTAFSARARAPAEVWSQEREGCTPHHKPSSSPGSSEESGFCGWMC
jgi:hypothetical protein